jgi:hypothetical protein
LNLTSNIGQLLQSFDLELFLTQNKHLNSSGYLLQAKGNTNELNWLLAEQLKLYPKAIYKLPEFVKHHCWFTSKSYEQSSGEASAIYKSSLFYGQSMLDLSGGLGVDDWAFSPNFYNIVSLDPNIELNYVVRENFKKLSLHNITRLDQTAEDYLLNTNSNNTFDLIYLDADRRPNETRNFFLDQGAPNFLAIQEICLKRSKKVLLKLSPMIDISYLKKVLNYIEKIIVIGDKHEVKELLVILKTNYQGEIIEEAVILNENKKNILFSTFSHASRMEFEAGEKYFFEPHPVIIKAGLSISYASFCGLNQLAPQSAFYIGNSVPESFMGRAFELINSFEFTKSNLQRFIKKHNLDQANITRRNFKQRIEEIRKTFKIKEGGKDYLFFTTLSNNTRMVYHCQKASI